MQIKSTITNKSGQVFDFTYNDIESELDLQGKKIAAVHGICFYKDKLVIVYSQKKGTWTPPGGGVEEGETAIEATVREIKEETNMKVLRQKFIGYQDIFDQKKSITQARSVCIVEPYGDFIRDPDGGEITEIKLIDPKDYKKYFDWGEIGEHSMKRALEIRDEWEKVDRLVYN
ncbi:MAG: NUDIX hydrolase [bacterium]